MKRGLIAWNPEEIPPAVFESRIDAFRRVLVRNGLEVGVVYSELWRSNHARSLQNFMPYFNRALLVIPVDGPTTLVCGLSPRVYKWIQSVTPITDVRPGKDFQAALEDLASERGWTRIGVFDEAGVPFDMHAGLIATHLEVVDVPEREFPCPVPDSTERSMRRVSADLARRVLDAEIGWGPGRTGHELAGRIERRLRLEGAEDVVLLFGHSDASPSPADASVLPHDFSVSAAVEYRGHWSRVSRAHSNDDALADLTSNFRSVLSGKLPDLGPSVVLEDLSTGYPYRTTEPGTVSEGQFVAVHLHAGRPRLVYGDTFMRTATGWDPL